MANKHHGPSLPKKKWKSLGVWIANKYAVCIKSKKKFKRKRIGENNNGGPEKEDDKFLLKKVC